FQWVPSVLPMKIWTSEHVFDHDWETVVHAAWRKYPNPCNGAVTAMDVMDQKFDEGRLVSERILQSHFPIPSWATKLTGFSGTQYSHEHTSIDPSARHMRLTTRNLCGSSFMRVDERLTYRPHASESGKTVLTQEASVTINLPAFTDYCEKTFLHVYETNAAKGRSGIEWVIDHLRKEVNDLTNKVSTEVHDMQEKVMGAFSQAGRR
ncbi:hypothetical protein PENTCL1PPCAC_7876, partial [Pristionchus entomophagus]